MVDTCLAVCLELGEPLQQLLLKVGGRIAAALSGADLHDYNVGHIEGEERLAIRMEWCLPISSVEVNAGEGLEPTSIGKLTLDVRHWLERRPDGGVN